MGEQLVTRAPSQGWGRQTHAGRRSKGCYGRLVTWKLGEGEEGRSMTILDLVMGGEW